MRSPLIRLSQSDLNRLELCPPHFQRVFLEQFETVKSPTQQDGLNWGNRFHLLMQQRELGIPLDNFLEQDEQLKQAFTALLNAVPELQFSGQKIWREAEHCRVLNFQGYLLTVIYDLLVTTAKEVKIFDWKTYQKPKQKHNLAANWQTRLYLYVLAETTNYLPEQISMTYWFIKPPTPPQKITFNYNTVQHQETEQALNRLLNNFGQWLDNYLTQGILFPHQTNCETECPYFSGNLNIANRTPSTDWLTVVENLEEINQLELFSP